MRIADIMTRTVHSIEPEATSHRAKAEMRRHGIRHLVVLDGGRIVGVLSERDLAARAVPDLEWSVADLMTSDVVVAAPEMQLSRAAALLRGRKIGCLPVVDGKQLVGIVTTSDLLDHLARGARARPHA